MIYSLKLYQREAVDELKEYLKIAFTSNNKKVIVFKAPTGSGKTFMASSLLEEIVEEKDDVNFCVIWACPGKGELHKQSFEAVKKYLGGNPICSLLEEDFFDSRKFIKNKEIVFINWEKLVQKDRETGKWANFLMKDREQANFIDVIDKTKKNGTLVILIVDESHIGSSQKARIQEFRDTIIIPNITLEMSATPLSEHIDVEIDPQKVIDEGMIKENVIVNEGISKDDLALTEVDSEILILEKGYEKRKQIVSKYKELGIYVNPLVLIQIPNVDDGEAKKLVITDFLRDKGITEDNGKLKFWCDNKGNFDKLRIKENNDITEFLVFKTAVATGWDCPRAHILIKFREGRSETFETQTIGRILRTAEAKSYGEYLLDNAYIFTNLVTFQKTSDTYCPYRIKTEFSKMVKPYDRNTIWGQTQLISFYRSRQGDYNSADSRFNEYFLKSFMSFFCLNETDKYPLGDTLSCKLIAKGMNLSLLTADEIIEETKMEAMDIDKNDIILGDSVTVKMSENDIQAAYNTLIKENLNGLAYVRSKSPINSAIINAFSTFYNIFPRSNKVKCIMQLVVNNRYIFSEILSKATQDFRELLSNELGKKSEKYEFKIDEIRPYSLETHTELIPAVKSLYQPLFVLKDEKNNPDNNLERDFLAYLDMQEEVEWYWENGTELMKTNFGISYNKGMNTFQPDFIVKFKDGTVGIFDTKPIKLRVEDTTVKADALIDYISKININRGFAPKVIGGIVIKQGTQFYIFSGSQYHDYSISTDGWENFNSIIRQVKFNIELSTFNSKKI